MLQAAMCGGALACVCHEVTEVVPPGVASRATLWLFPAAGFAACYVVAVAGQQWAAKN